MEAVDKGKDEQVTADDTQARKDDIGEKEGNEEKEGKEGNEEKEESAPIVALKTIFQSLEAAQSRTGAFSLADARNLVLSYNMLLSFFQTLDAAVAESKEKPLAIALHFNTLHALFKGLEIQNSKGVYSLEGAKLLIDKAEFLESVLSSVKDPNLKIDQGESAQAPSKGTTFKSGKKKKSKK